MLSGYLPAVLLLTIGQALAETPVQRVERVWTAGSERMATAGSLPVPILDRRDITTVGSGDVLLQRRREDGADWAIGVAWLDHPVDAIWVAMIDNAHDDQIEGFRELTLSTNGPNDIQLFGELTLTRPLSTRLWVVRLRNPAGVFTRTNAALWERVWDLEPEAALDRIPSSYLSASDRRSAVYTPVNEGGWSLLPDGDGTLLVYQTRTAIGGMVPDELVLRVAMSRIDDLVRHIEDLAKRSLQHYGDEHEALLRPDGSEIPRF